MSEWILRGLTVAGFVWLLWVVLMAGDRQRSRRWWSYFD